MLISPAPKTQYPSIPMETTAGTVLIMRRSIHTFLQNYHYGTAAALLCFPFSAAILLSQALILPVSPLLPTVHSHLRSLFDAAGFPPSSEFFAILSLKLSQTITSSILVLPFTLSFLLLSKAFIIQALILNHHDYKPPPNPSWRQASDSSFLSVYSSILLTQVCNSLVILSANATCFFLLFLAFTTISPTSLLVLLLLSATAAFVYSIILANALIVCSLALVSSGMDKCGGYLAILKACVLIRGRSATALALAVPVNMALGAAEALFQYRVVRAYYRAQGSLFCVVLEGILIAYLYSIIIVIDTIVGCVLFKSCKRAHQIDQERRNNSNWSVGNIKEEEEDYTSTRATLNILAELA
ncbi:uncharacterized protein LOC127791161 [Diospyros lotus]|uniref:uncharacterized protein LOC127791161 n=1 Tax=Diospyros lotus TaxID=55363 RepID=UPI0022541C71|nr:uncharacterized protein LOC127791161 [Diospyros lotus]